MTTSTCRICGQPVHRYSPDHPGTPDDLMGCVNSLRGALEEVEVERDHYRAQLEQERRIAHQLLPRFSDYVEELRRRAAIDRENPA